MEAVTAVQNLIFPNLRLTVSEILIPIWQRKSGETINEIAEFRGKMVAYDGNRIRQQFRDNFQPFVTIERDWQIRLVLMAQPKRFSQPDDQVILAPGKPRQMILASRSMNILNSLKV